MSTNIHTGDRQLFMDALDRDIHDGIPVREIFGLYMRLSEVLVDEPSLPDWLGRGYMLTLLAGTEKPEIPPYTLEDIYLTLMTFAEILDSGHDIEAQVIDRIVRDPRRGPVAKSLTYLWYTASLPDLGSGFQLLMAERATYASGLVWDYISGNPMGIPGPYYGNWGYPPPQLILDPGADAPGAGARGDSERAPAKQGDSERGQGNEQQQ